MPSLPDDPDRYHARPVDVFDWCVWDIRRNEPVFGSDLLREDEARRTATNEPSLSSGDVPGRDTRSLLT
jgi:hypothetical protein